MFRSLVTVSLIFTLCFSAQAAVVLDFDADTEGFVLNSGSSVTQDAFNGGSLRITTDGGDDAAAAQLNFAAASAIGMELAQAQSSGGTISFDVFVVADDQVGGPGFYQSAAILQSDSNGAAEPGTFSRENEFLSVPSAGSQSFETITYQIVNAANGSPEANNSDGNLHYQGTASGGKIFLGINNSSGYSSATIYVDNFTITAVPEPSSFALLGFAGLGFVVRRRRK
ncbi:PEP-CTERM sorting domain-containing protein [Planctomycetes bacterium K23_9]|uniref:PEP-CTERM motif protein n=1 Tax=Stieleria marina TaxID=1930275 RepID=A0A517NX58_9BACT|nr:PEP-CTERM motif protein [Planctomycetes bacterium K23_9]